MSDQGIGNCPWYPLDDGAPFGARRHDVVEGAGELDSQGPCHGEQRRRSRLRRQALITKCALTPHVPPWPNIRKAPTQRSRKASKRDNELRRASPGKFDRVLTLTRPHQPLPQAGGVNGTRACWGSSSAPAAPRNQRHCRSFLEPLCAFPPQHSWRLVPEPAAKSTGRHL